MKRCGLLPCYVKTNEAGNKSQVDFEGVELAFSNCLAGTSNIRSNDTSKQIIEANQNMDCRSDA